MSCANKSIEMSLELQQQLPSVLLHTQEWDCEFTVGKCVFQKASWIHCQTK